MDAFDFIKKEHKRLDKAFSKLANTPAEEEETRENIFNNLKKKLEIHMKLEESMLYPMLKRQSELRGRVFEGIVEHDESKNLLREMNSMKKNSEVWLAKFVLLRENMEHHNKVEEDELFPEAREILNQNEIDDLGRSLLEEKEKLFAEVI
jgi:iron-sulfur cluster repair protein YtfE (RIC family)